jgi:predicted MFS family arabinose efflux permease
MLILFYTLIGPANSMVNPMSSTLVAENFPKEKRTTALGWLIAGGSISFIIGAKIISTITGIGGWRLAFLAFMLPVSLVGLIFVNKFIPSKDTSQIRKDSKISFEAFRAVLYQRFSASCLIGTMFRMATFQLMLSYGVSFIRQQFAISRDISSLILTAIALSYTFGSLFAGKIVNIYGRKNVASIVLGIASVLLVIFLFSSNYWFAVSIYIILFWFFGMSVSAGQSLNLEQVPKFRGTMMSLTSAFSGVGSTLGSGLGGLILLLYNWGTLGVIFGLMGFVGTITMYFFASDISR